MNTDNCELRAVLLRLFLFVRATCRATMALECGRISAQIYSRQPWIVFLSSLIHGGMWKAWVLLMDANHRQLSAGLQWVWRCLPCYGGCFFLCTCFLWGMATNCVVRATEFWAVSNSIIDSIAIERCAFGGGREKADCRLAVLLVFCCCVCRFVGGGVLKFGN